MSQMPPNWRNPALGEIAEVTSGIGFPKDFQGQSNGDLGFFKVGDISKAVLQNGGVLEHPEHVVSFEVAEKLKGTLIKPGATVFAKIGEAIKLKRRAIVKHDCLIDNNVMAVKALEHVSDRYLYHFLRTVDFTEQSRATTVPSLRKGDVEQLNIPLAPLAEQKRIADKLDATLARVDACRERLARVAPILKRFRQSVLAAAISGRLTADWRNSSHRPHVSHNLQELEDARRKAWITNQERKMGSAADHQAITKRYKSPVENAFPSTHKAPGEWITVSIDAVTFLVTDGKHGDCRDELNSGYYFLSVKDLFDRRMNYQNARQIKKEDFEEVDTRTFLEAGDVLITNAGTIGRVAVLQDQELARHSTLQKSVAVLKPVYSTIKSNFLAIYLEALVETLKNQASGTAVKNLLLGDLKKMPITLPTLMEQHEIVRRVESLFAFADRLEARLTAAQTAAEQLTPALLAKAFRGELVPQDPADEPASELLQRLAASRASADKPKRGRTPRQPA